MKAQEVIRKFQDECEYGFLATCDGQQPRIRPMSPVAVDGNIVWMAAYAGSNKIEQIASNPHVELCYMDAQRRHLRLVGTAELVMDEQLKREMWDRAPVLKEYFRTPTSPQYVLIKMLVTEAMLMEKEMEYETLEV